MAEKIKCSACGDTKVETNFYSSTSHFHRHTGKLHVCKDCLWDHVGDEYEDVEVVISAMRMIDKPFLYEIYESSFDQAIAQKWRPIQMYMKNIGMPQYKNLNFKDSVYKNKNNEALLQDDIEITQKEHIEMKKFWGRGMELEDYLWLQNEYEDWISRYECDSKAMELLIKQICLMQLDVEKRRANGEKVDTLLKTLQDLLGSSNLKPAQETGAQAADQQTFGTWIKKFENDQPIPEPDEEWKDVDGIKKYMNVWFFGHLARMLGIKNDNEKEYWDEVEKYKVELDEDNGNKEDKDSES